MTIGVLLADDEELVAHRAATPDADDADEHVYEALRGAPGKRSTTGSSHGGFRQDAMSPAGERARVSGPEWAGPSGRARVSGPE